MLYIYIHTYIYQIDNKQRLTLDNIEVTIDS